MTPEAAEYFIRDWRLKASAQTDSIAPPWTGAIPGQDRAGEVALMARNLGERGSEIEALMKHATKRR